MLLFGPGKIIAVALTYYLGKIIVKTISLDKDIGRLRHWLNNTLSWDADK